MNQLLKWWLGLCVWCTTMLTLARNDFVDVRRRAAAIKRKGSNRTTVAFRKLRGAFVACLLMAGTLSAWSDTGLRHASIFLLLTRARIVAGPVEDGGVGGGGDGGGGGGALMHFGSGPTSVTEPTYAPNNTPGVGDNHSPANGDQLQTVLGSLSAGDNIYLSHNTLYSTGSHDLFVFPVVAGADVHPVTVFGSSNTSHFPTPGARWIATTYRQANPHFRAISGGTTPVLVAPRSTGWRFVGVQIDDGSAHSLYGVFRAGPFPIGGWGSTYTYASGDVVYGGRVSRANGNLNHATTDDTWWRDSLVSDLADQVILDRCDVAKLRADSGPHCVYLAAKNVTLTGCAIWNEGGVGETSAEDTGVAMLDCEGPFLMDNCYVVACGINFIIGGGDPNIPNYNPSNFTIRRCHLFKPLRFDKYHSAWDGIARREKNTWELKRGKFVVLEDCLLENHWDAYESQYFPVTIKLNNQDGGNRGAQTDNVTVRYLRFKNTLGPFIIGYRYNVDPHATNMSFYHCYSETLVGMLPGYGNFSPMFQFDTAMTAFTFAHMTFLGNPNSILTSAILGDSIVPVGWHMQNCILSLNGYGMFSDSSYLNGKRWFSGTGSSIDNILLYNMDAIAPGGPTGAISGSDYSNPPFTVSTVPNDLVQDWAANNFRAATPFINAGFEGRTPGCDIDLVNTRTSGCVSGVWS